MGMTLKAARVNIGLTLVTASQKLNVSKDTLSNWERGITFPSVKQLKNIEHVYGVSYNDLIFLPDKFDESEV